jgi:hypothetical protein
MSESKLHKMEKRIAELEQEIAGLRMQIAMLTKRTAIPAIPLPPAVPCQPNGPWLLPMGPVTCEIDTVYGGPNTCKIGN